MKFLYKYQSGSAVLEREVSASSQDAAYSLLRKSGIRPMQVWAKPGVLNRLSGLMRWWWGVLLVGILGVVVFFATTVGEAPKGAERQEGERPLGKAGLARPVSRHQLPPFTADFKFESESVLACFARPGDLSMVGDPEVALARFCSDLELALETPVAFGDADVPEVTELRRIVIGMKEEVRLAVRSGENVADIFARLYERQKMESAYRAAARATVEREIGNPGFDRLLLETNESLRLMGLKEIEIRR